MGIPLAMRLNSVVSAVLHGPTSYSHLSRSGFNSHVAPLSHNEWLGQKTMNIFVLDEDLQQSAEWHADEHVVTGIKEVFQGLSETTRRVYEDRDYLYKDFNPKHTVSLWLQEARENFEYGLEYCEALETEFEARGFRGNGPGFSHLTIGRVRELEAEYQLYGDQFEFPLEGQTPFPRAFNGRTYPELGDIEAHRRFYVEDKYGRISWNRAPWKRPEWFDEMAVQLGLAETA